jgi:hypothetical protein
LALQADGTWFLNTTNSAKAQVVLATGQVEAVASPAAGWQRLSLSCSGTLLTAQINGRVVAAVHDKAWADGYAGLASGWHLAWFDRFSVV